MLLKELKRKIKKRETPFYNRLYNILKKFTEINMPVIWPLHHFLHAERQFRLSFSQRLCRFLYYEPLFKSQCVSVGKGLRIYDGLPQICGNLQLIIGDKVVLHGTSTFVGAKVFDRPTLRIGNNSHLGSNFGIVVGRDVNIGNNVLIANGVNIFSYDQHPANPAERHLPASPESSRPVTIEDNVWVGAKCVIFKGVVIGRNSVVAAGSVVTQKVPPDSLVIGNPARAFPLMF